MFDNTFFKKLADSGSPTGQVVGTSRFLVSIKGLNGVGVGAQIVFESGQRGMVRVVEEDLVQVLNLEAEDTPLGSFAALHSPEIYVNTGDDMIGRVIDPLGKPIDGQGPITTTQSSPLFKQAPGVIERALLKDQLNSELAF